MATELKLHIGMQNGRSVITESHFTSPLKLGTPKTGGKRLKVVLMMASAGILKGDAFSYDIVCDKDTRTFLTEQSYTKIFDTGDGRSDKQQRIELKEGASLYYRPCAVIPFKGSTFDGNMTVNLNKGSEFIYADIVTAGRVGMGERFYFKHYRNRVCVMEDESPVWLDNCLLEPVNMKMDNMIFFDGYTHQGTFYYYGSTEREEQLLQYAGEENEKICCGVSAALKGVCIRFLAYTAQDIEEAFNDIEALLYI